MLLCNMFIINYSNSCIVKAEQTEPVIILCVLRHVTSLSSKVRHATIFEPWKGEIAVLITLLISRSVLFEMSATIPEGLTELLEEFAVAVLREKPSDLLQFAAQYFNNSLEQRTQTTAQRVGPDQMESENMAADTAGREIEMTITGGTNAFSLD